MSCPPPQAAGMLAGKPCLGGGWATPPAKPLDSHLDKSDLVQPVLCILCAHPGINAGDDKTQSQSSRAYNLMWKAAGVVILLVDFLPMEALSELRVLGAL